MATSFESISVCCPTRGRPDMCMLMARSIVDTAQGGVQLLLAMDDDDPADYDLDWPLDVLVSRAGRGSLGEMYNRLGRLATAPVLMLTGDDMHFRTPGWDRAVAAAARRYRDGVYCLYGDVEPGKPMACANYVFIDREVTRLLGYTAPPFLNRYIDSWWFNIASELRRAKRLDILVEHMHHFYGKGVLDDTNRELSAKRHFDHARFRDTKVMRAADAERLRARMLPAIGELI